MAESNNRKIEESKVSSTDGARLVTTDQSNELRVYRAPLWDLETTIIHTHRRFQYLTPIKAAWHPLEDIIVVGRYADANIPQFSKPHIIDMFDAASGNLVYEMSNPEHKGIAVLNKFNSTGDMMASGIGYSIAIMKPSPMLNSNSHFSQNKKRLKRTSDKSIPCAPRPKNAK
uniref:Uncharacterized protein n=1 Tax=Timema poppense TaxID=170557 RepID=A0A7R9H5M3_TIMPO|nr:unnamed protein product [Timema poppensis]